MTQADRKIRLFIAVQVPQEAQEVLAGAMEYLESALPGQVRWVGSHRIHLTVQFLGDVAASCTGDILDGMRRAAEAFEGAPFELGLGRLGCFHRQKSARVLWSGVQGDMETLRTLHGCVDSALQEKGFPPDRQPYRPHLTLGRPRNNRVRLETASLTPAFDGWEAPRRVWWTVDTIHLIHSVLDPGKQEYVTLGSVRLGGVVDG